VHEKITIFGAGISGLVAAINLAQSGFGVEVREKRSQVGGSPKWHPSVHLQMFDMDKTSDSIGIDIAPCFHAVKKHTFYFYGRKSENHSPANSYVCEKGQRPSSIENYLYLQAKKFGVRFVFAEAYDSKNIERPMTETQPYIVAAGLEYKPYIDLDLKHVTIQGFRSSRKTPEEDIAISYFGRYTNHEFAYLASFGNLLFALLFSRRGMDKRDLEAFRQHLLENENLTFEHWHFSTGCVPLEKHFEKNGVILAGTISGMIDPFYLNGISAALISGKIAALFFTDKKKAFQEFNRFTRNFYIKLNLQRLSYKLPAKKISFPVVASYNNHLKNVGVI